MYIFLAVGAGMLTIVSMILNARLAEKTSTTYGTVINFAMGLLVALLLSFTNIGIYGSIVFNFPWYLLLGGVIGIVVVQLSNYVIPKIPALYSTMLIFSGQIMMGLLLDVALGNVIDYQKIMGAGIMIVALMWIAHIDGKKKTVVQ